MIRSIAIGICILVYMVIRFSQIESHDQAQKVVIPVGIMGVPFEFNIGGGKNG